MKYFTKPVFLTAFALSVTLGIALGTPVLAADIIVRSGQLATPISGTGGNSEISYDGGASWTRFTVLVDYYNLNTDYTGVGTDTASLGTVTTANLTPSVIATDPTYSGGVVPNTKALSTGDTGAGFYRLHFSFTAPTSNYTASGLMRSDNAGYDAVLNYGTSNQKTMNSYSLNTTNAPTNNAIRTTGNVPSSAMFSDSRNFSGGGTQDFSLIYYNNSGAQNASFQVNFQPVPAPPAAVSLGIGGLVGMVNVFIKRRKITATRKRVR